MSRRTRVGVVGSGWVARARHLPSFVRVADVDVVGVADRHISRAREGAAAVGAPLACDSLDRLLDEGVDIVSVATSPWSHAELTVQALEAGCHVFCEKPMAMSAAEAELMVRTAERVERLLCVSHNFLFSRSVRRATKLFGTERPTYATALQLSSFARRLPTWHKDLPGGLMLDESPHMLYVLTRFLGAPLRLNHARASKKEGDEWPSTIELLLDGDDAVGAVTMCFDSPVSEWHVGLISAGRVVGLDLFRDIVTAVGSDGEHKALDIARTSGKVMLNQLVGVGSTGARVITRRQFWGHDELIRLFVEACRNSTPSPVDPRDSLSIVALTDEILSALDLTSP